ncbi:MAG: DUF2214 domain-containing protein [Pseudomonadota bacterium]
MLAELVAPLEGLELARLIRTSRTLYPLANGTHILAFAILVGSIAVYDITILRGISDRQLATAVLPVTWASFAATVLSGGLLFATRATHYAENPAFIFKFGLVVAAALNMLAFHRAIMPMRASAALSLVLWASTLMAGRWIGFL